MMEQSYEEVPIERIVREGLYCKDIEFNSNEDNIRRLIPYLVALPPSPDSLATTIAILRFYRFPIIICFTSLYQKIDQLEKEKQQLMQEQLKEIAAILSALLKLTGQDHFKQVAIFFKWGIAKKRFRFQISPPEIEFATFIVGLSAMKVEIEKLGSVQGGKEEKSQKINDFLSMKMNREMNPFEEYFVNHIMTECGPAILKIQDEEEPVSKKDIKERKKEKATQDNKPVISQDFPSLLSKESSKKLRPPSVDKRPIMKEQSQAKQQKTFVHNQQESILSNPHNSSDKLNRRPRAPLFINECAIIPMASVTPICCRTFFYIDETIEQPESLRIQYKFYCFPFQSKQDEVPSKREKIRRALCGFLNAEGGTVYFGIKEDCNNYQRFINGMFMTESAKVEFRKQIFNLLKDIRPDVGKRLQIKWVPLRSRKDNNYISGKYVAKVIIERGVKDQVYSYEQPINNNRWEEKFAFRTENEVLLKTGAQEILKIFKDKIENPERNYFPVHPYPCKEPEVGKQVIGDQFSRGYSYEQEGSYAARDGNKRSARIWEVGKDELGDKLEQQTVKLNKERKKYMQKNCNEFMVKSTSDGDFDKEDLEIQLRKMGQLPTEVTEIKRSPSIFYVRVEDINQPLKFKTNLKAMQIYGRLSYRNLNAEQMEILEKTIIPGYKQIFNQDMRNRQDKILVFHSGFEAAKFYVKSHEMQFKLEFTPEG